MENHIVDIISVDLVLVGVSLINQSKELDAFIDQVEAESISTTVGISPDVSGALPAPPTTHELLRDRIKLTTSPDRTTILKEFPSLIHLEEDLRRLTDVVLCAIRNTDLTEQQLRAYGYNMQLVFDPGIEESASSYIGRCLFGGQFNWQLLGGAGQLFFSDEGRRWAFGIQPRPSNDMNTKRIYLSVNLHFEEKQIPQSSQIISSLEELKGKALDFMTQLHGGS